MKIFALVFLFLIRLRFLNKPISSSNSTRFVNGSGPAVTQFIVNISYILNLTNLKFYHKPITNPILGLYNGVKVIES